MSMVLMKWMVEKQLGSAMAVALLLLLMMMLYYLSCCQRQTHAAAVQNVQVQKMQ